MSVSPAPGLPEAPFPNSPFDQLPVSPNSPFRLVKRGVVGQSKRTDGEFGSVTRPPGVQLCIQGTHFADAHLENVVKILADNHMNIETPIAGLLSLIANACQVHLTRAQGRPFV